MITRDYREILVSAVAILALCLSGCQTFNTGNAYSAKDLPSSSEDFDYLIGPGDTLNIFVWRNPDVSASGIPVLPDGRISTPLAGEIMARGKTPVQLAEEIEKVLSNVIKNPYVTVTVSSYVGGYEQQVRVVGEAAAPRALPYSNGMTLLDVMIAVGGLTEFAAGNRAVIVRNIDGSERQYNVKLEDLLKGGDINANVDVAPGDIIVIPESLF